MKKQRYLSGIIFPNHYIKLKYNIIYTLGERKAIFEDCESEKTENKDRIKKLKDEVRDLQAEVQASNKSSEGILRHVQVNVNPHYGIKIEYLLVYLTII